MYVSEEDFFQGYFSGFPIEASVANVDRVRSFVLEKWTERQTEIGKPSPSDLSGSCKFSSLFGSVVFGADIGGNYDHVYNVLDDVVIDVNAGSADVAALAAPYLHDPYFIRSDDFHESMMTCVSRVENWIAEYLERYDQGLSLR